MTYIKIKVKHLLIGIAVVLAVSAAVMNLQGGILYMMGKLSELGGSNERAAVYYDRAVKDDPSSLAAILAAQRKLELIFAKKDFGYFKKLKMAGGSTLLDGGYISADSADRVNLQYEGIAEYAARGDEFAEYSVYVAMLNYFAGYGEKAVKILKSLDYVKNEELKKRKELNLAAMQMGLGDMDGGFETLKEGIDQKDEYSVIRRELYSYYCFMKGDFANYEKSKADTTEWHKATKALDALLLKPLLEVDNTLSGYEDIVERTGTLRHNGNIFSGKVTIDGKPAEYMMVYLKDTAYRNSESSSMGINSGIYCVAVTGSDGSFRIENVPNGIYGVGVGVDWQRVQGRALHMDKSFSLKFAGSTVLESKISFLDTGGMVRVGEAGEGRFTFKVNLPAGADHYTISMGELREVEDNQMIANNTFLSESTDAPEYTLDVVRERTRGMNTGASYSTNGIDPRYLFEPFYHTGEYAYYVTFYNKSGDILYDSDGIYPNRHKQTLHIEGSQWREADKLLLDRKYDEAIKLYETQIMDGQEDLHALKVLAKLYYNGWEYDAATSALKNKDSRRAKEYFEKLADRIKDNEQINDSLAGLYLEEERYAEGLEILHRNKSPYSRLQIARVYGYMGDFKKAEEYYKSFNKATGHGADSLLMLYLLQDRRDLLPETAASYIDNGSFYADHTELIQNYLTMDNAAYNEFFRLIGDNRPDDAAAFIRDRKDDLALLYKGLLLLQQRLPDYHEREKQYKMIYDDVKNPTIRQLLQYFGKSGIQSRFGDE